MVEPISSKRFRKDVRLLWVYINKFNVKIALLDVVLNEVVPNLNIFWPRMHDMILSKA